MYVYYILYIKSKFFFVKINVWFNFSMNKLLYWLNISGQEKSNEFINLRKFWQVDINYPKY